ncbi:MAG: helix-turn-helix domain-containing protein [Candidatus Accumulibacter sp.]|uniref:helix-turn-helix domain-containing protein n=1 Tax=Accumulibacter sp. TaxID=2053492 RepID=UPI001ACE3379|nr:helix-turn-helix transcriptional regulator [Accumulibacter sp.]MBN8516605.1 helix-turn-helix domain-containing protein [Accumulibacter sp.]MBO3710238.1 helix-turn-helix domain-containing protein [Accumulibacter sp.]
MLEVDNLKMSVGTRIKQARGVLGLTQKDLCEATGMPLPSLKNYEASQRIPGGDAIAALMHAGINANWLLTGEGPMLLAELQAPSTHAPGMDRDRLRRAVKAMEKGLSAGGITMPPGKKAGLLLAVYDLLEEPGVTEEKVINLVIAAATSLYLE